MAVCNVSTPAQYFHVLRRQMRDAKRMPLIMMTPKSLLRHPLVISTPEDFTEGKFNLVIDDANAVPANINRVVFCSAKVYYDALQMQRDNAINNVALVRVEQFYPYPEQELRAIAEKYSKASDIVWLQEESKNMGAWHFLADRIRETILPSQKLRYAGRSASASTATGSLKRHQTEQEELLKDALM